MVIVFCHREIFVVHVLSKNGGGGWGGGAVGTIEGEREVSMRYILLSICGSYIGVGIGIGLHSVGTKKDMHLCPCMKVLHNMYLHVIEYSKVWAYMQMYVSV